MAKIPLLLPVLAALSAGCVVDAGTATPASYSDLHEKEGWILVDGVEPVAQQTEQDCGAAALSTVLAHWGVDVPAAALREECTVPGVEGLRAAELRDAARRRGFSAFLLEGSVADLEHELRRGRPFVVGLVKSLGPWSSSHFEVVVGLLPSEEVAAIDPAHGLMRDGLPAFAAEWAATKGVTLVVFRPAAKGALQAVAGP